MSANGPTNDIFIILNRMEDKFDARFNRLDDRLDRLDDKIDDVSKLTDKNTIVLEDHQRRSLANEEANKLLKEQIGLQRQETAALIEASEKKQGEKESAQDQKVKDLADSVEIFVKLPQYLYKIAVWSAAISAGGAALYGLLRALSYVIQQTR